MEVVAPYIFDVFYPGSLMFFGFPNNFTGECIRRNENFTFFREFSPNLSGKAFIV
jgi:hypothetical protein